MRADVQTASRRGRFFSQSPPSTPRPRPPWSTARSAPALMTSSAAGTSRSPSPGSRSAATPACSPSRPIASSSRSAASSGCPTRCRPNSPGFAGSIKINVLTLVDRRVWQNCLYTLDRDGRVKERWTQWDHLCEGSSGPGPHRLRISPYDPRTPRLGDQRDLPPDLRVLERRQAAAEDAGREERAGQRRHALRQAAGRGVSSRRPRADRRRPRQPSRHDSRSRR